MSAPLVWLAKKAAGKVVANKISQVVSEPYDPLYEMKPNSRGKLKRVRRPIPDYLSPKDKALLIKIRTWASRLDTSHSFLGIRYGWSAVIGLIPAVGDVIDGLLSLYVYQMCKQVEGGLDVKTKAVMKAWIVADVLVGLIPILGDLVDAYVKCNARNCQLLEEFLAVKYGAVPPPPAGSSPVGKVSPTTSESEKSNSSGSEQGLLLPRERSQATYTSGAASPQPAVGRSSGRAAEL